MKRAAIQKPGRDPDRTGRRSSRTMGDRVQLQQVIVNLILNGIEAMSAVTDRPGGW